MFFRNIVASGNLIWACLLQVLEGELGADDFVVVGGGKDTTYIE